MNNNTTPSSTSNTIPRSTSNTIPVSTSNIISAPSNIFSLNNLMGFICTYCCFSLFMICVAIYKCGNITDYSCALACPCLYAFYIMANSIRGCNNK